MHTQSLTLAVLFALGWMGMLEMNFFLRELWWRNENKCKGTPSTSGCHLHSSLALEFYIVDCIEIALKSMNGSTVSSNAYLYECAWLYLCSRIWRLTPRTSSLLRP